MQIHSTLSGSWLSGIFGKSTPPPEEPDVLLDSYTLQQGQRTLTVGGQPVGPEQDENARLRDETIHSYGLDDKENLVELQFSSLLKQAPPAKAPRSGRDVSAKTVDKLQISLGDERAAALTKKLQPGHDRAIPKDASFHPDSYLMFSDSFDATSKGYALEMAQVGRVEGFGVQLMTGGSKTLMRSAVPEDNVAYLGTGVSGACWTEDYGERTFSGAFVVPAYLETPSLVDDAIDADRAIRFKKGPSADFSQHGQVSKGNYQEVLLSAGRSLGLETREAFSHIEGGNVLTGTLPNGKGYVLVGKDSLAVSREKLSQDLGRKVSAKETLQYIASDLGTDPENVHAVEQPGEFHLDMRLLCAAPGEVILNDAREAFQQQAEWMHEDYQKSKPVPAADAGFFGRLNQKRKEWVWEHRGSRLEKRLEKMQDEAERRASYEDLTARDLKAAGLKVDRMAAVFLDPSNPEEDITNFTNGRGGINDKGERFFVGLGAEPRFEAYAAEKLLKTLPTGFSRVHFLSRDLTPDTLSLAGGIKCRTKPFGHEATLAELITPYPSRLYTTKG